MLREPFITGEVYHIFNRGVEKRMIFMDDADRRRFWLCLAACNTDKPVIDFSKKIAEGNLELPDRPEHLVHILAYCLMPNHYHLLVVQAVDDGIRRFMHKFGTAYTMYFNTLYERVGPLFQGVFKAVNVNQQEQLLYIPHYIHANALDMDTRFAGWRNSKIADIKNATEYLRAYQWSSYCYYANVKNDSVIDEESVLEFFEDRLRVAKDMNKWLGDMKINNTKIDLNITLESDKG